MGRKAKVSEIKREEPRSEPKEGQVFSPRHEFKLYKAIRESPTLSMGAKVTWESLVDLLWDRQTFVERNYRQISKYIGASESRAKRFVRDLKKHRLVQLTPKWNEEGRQVANRITFLWRDPESIREGGG
jgi:hypothetical protein